MVIDPGRPVRAGPLRAGTGRSSGEPPSRPRGVRVVVVSDQGLIAEAVAAALRQAGLDARSAGSALGGGGGPALADVPCGPRGPSMVGIALLEADHTDLLQAVEQLFASAPQVRWIVLTGVPAGPLWGAVLEAGAVRVMERTAGLDELAAAADEVARDSPEAGEDEDALREAWDRAQAADSDAALLSLLTPAEREVLDLLYAGNAVREVAARRGVTVATTRDQVQAVLRKWGVSSQLAAVARYAEMREGTDEPGVPDQPDEPGEPGESGESG